MASAAKILNNRVTYKQAMELGDNYYVQH